MSDKSASKEDKAVFRQVSKLIHCSHPSRKIRNSTFWLVSHSSKLSPKSNHTSCDPEPRVQVAANAVYVSLWIGLSGTVILYNKWILAYYGFPCEHSPQFD